MLKVVATVCLLLAVNAAPSYKKGFPSNKIVGGAATTIEEVPWQVAIEELGYLYCGGSIISENYILTAATCTYGRNATDIRVRSGTSLLESGGTLNKISVITRHPQFNISTMDYDIAVLKLADPIPLSSVQAAVPLSSATEGDTAKVTGWGLLHWGDVSGPLNLQAVEFPVLSSEDCKYTFGPLVTDRMFCAGEEGKDHCQGDAGGALTVDGNQAGIVSWGFICAEIGYPGVYTDVALLADFINQSSNNEAVWA